MAPTARGEGGQERRGRAGQRKDGGNGRWCNSRSDLPHIVHVDGGCKQGLELAPLPHSAVGGVATEEMDAAVPHFSAGGGDHVAAGLVGREIPKNVQSEGVLIHESVFPIEIEQLRRNLKGRLRAQLPPVHCRVMSVKLKDSPEPARRHATRCNFERQADPANVREMTSVIFAQLSA
eukprot:6789051-Pyramimonas_sp.AAC.1